MAIFCHVLKTAIDEWGLSLPVERFRAVRKPSLPPGRIRRLSAEEQAKAAEALSSCRNPIVKAVFDFALATGMRRGEVLSLTWQNVDFENRVAFLPITKNGEPRRVPLSTEAIETLQSIRESVWREKNLVFPTTANAVRLAWQRAKRRAGVENLRFHDLRHEAISRFFELGLSVPEVSLISGHKDARMLFRYTHLKAENVAKKIEELTQR
jgi:integrase